MVAARKNAQPTARNVVRRSKREEPLVEGRKQPRVKVTVPAWVCGQALSGRGYALEMNAAGARFGGMGLKLEVGEAVIVKLVVDPAEAPIVMRGEVVRYAPSAWACPDLCVKFVDAPVDEHFRVAQLLERQRR